MICSEIDEVFAAFNVPADKYKSADGQLKPIPDPVAAPVVDAAETNAKKNRTQLTPDDLAMAFHLANR
jgi:hypothetical protein